MKNKKILFIKICYYTGFIADLIATIALVSPKVSGVTYEKITSLN